MSYSYTRHKKYHEELVAMINRKELAITVAGVDKFEFDYIVWSSYSETLKVYRKGGQPDLVFYAKAFDVTPDFDLLAFRDAYIFQCEAERQRTYGLVEFFQDIMDELPHGSGIDADWTLGEQTEKDVQFCNSYHTMDENGGYNGWLDFAVTYEYNFANRSVKSVLITMADSERMIEETCEECEGAGVIDGYGCANCGGVGTFEYDELDDHREYLYNEFPEEIKLDA